MSELVALCESSVARSAVPVDQIGPLAEELRRQTRLQALVLLSCTLQFDEGRLQLLQAVPRGDGGPTVGSCLHRCEALSPVSDPLSNNRMRNISSDVTMPQAGCGPAVTTTVLRTVRLFVDVILMPFPGSGVSRSDITADVDAIEVSHLCVRSNG